MHRPKNAQAPAISYIYNERPDGRTPDARQRRLSAASPNPNPPNPNPPAAATAPAATVSVASTAGGANAEGVRQENVRLAGRVAELEVRVCLCACLLVFV